MSAAAPVRNVAIVGGGIMGSGIAEVCARGGLSTLVVEVSDAALERSRARIATSLDRAVARGKVDSDDASQTIGQIGRAHV